MIRILLYLGVLALTFCVGFGVGVYTLPILVEYQASTAVTPPPPATDLDRRGAFRRDLPGSDLGHWGEGGVRLSESDLVIEDGARFSPGPDYRVYLTTRFVDTKSDFLRIKGNAVEIGRMKKFTGPLTYPVPAEVDTNAYDNVVVWCEAFSMFISSARLD